jgi:hypothetical protein
MNWNYLMLTALRTYNFISQFAFWNFAERELSCYRWEISEPENILRTDAKTNRM